MFRDRKGLLLGLGVLFGLVGLVSTSFLGRQSPGVAELQIPQETKDYLRKLAEQIDDLRFVPRVGKGEPTNDGDQQEATSRNFQQKLTSDDFVVYYHTGQRRRAEDVLSLAQGSEGRMVKFFSRFPHAKTQGGRKLPVFVCDDKREYVSLVGSDSVGCVIWEVYDNRMLPRMYLSPVAFEARGGGYLKSVVNHEMTHYVQFAWIDPTLLRKMGMWFIEGLACYVSEDTTWRAAFVSLKRASGVIPLPQLFDKGKEDSLVRGKNLMIYAQGYMVLQFVTAAHGEQAVVASIPLVAENGDAPAALYATTRSGAEALRSGWERYILAL